MTDKDKDFIKKYSYKFTVKELAEMMELKVPTLKKFIYSEKLTYKPARRFSKPRPNKDYEDDIADDKANFQWI